METIIDDGSLECLKIPRDENNRSFNCDETTQSKLVNTTFWVVDFIEDVPTKFSKAKYLMFNFQCAILNLFSPYAICQSPQQKSDLTFSIIFVHTLVPSASMPLC